MKGNVLVGQSGGPTAVINSSLAGVFKTAMERGYMKALLEATVPFQNEFAGIRISTRPDAIDDAISTTSSFASFRI